MVTIRDVAAAAGVSVSTVSRVLSGQYGVSEATKREVERVSRRLNYRPSAAAASLRTRSTGVVGMLVPEITNPYFPAVVQGVEQEFAGVGVDLILCDSGNDVDAEAHRLETLLRRRVDALIICPVDTERSAAALRSIAGQVPLLQIDRHAVDNVDFVGVDESSGIAQVVVHLAANGITSAAFVGIAAGISSIAERAQAFTAACQAHGIAALPAVTVTDTDVAAGRQAARELLSAGTPRPQAIVCANDLLAFGVVAELTAAGLRCPQDVAVTGYDDSPAAELIGLSSVRQPLSDIGREAVRLVRNQSPSPRSVRLAPQFIARATTPPAASSPTTIPPVAGS
ncbi:LacI family transcriptional regulator [Kribbella sp. VKM Ac-2527]|uniref:LacI family transcriptional regulator n=1 Tax=Kribbella caucasensis TaxID=2512215 RepID=A0A4V6PT59_9ACTN|nr:LacI family DNA-binding transcriptional regulator [Kribbella sp. VKM Ac-2527]TDO50138.1 LacI family transcriptional regulator [Kribbella sp. VKM Ac-2527]